MTTRHCRCGHHRSAHKGPRTECFGLRAAGKNAVGVPQRRYCKCKSYRPTGVNFWQRILYGTEESLPYADHADYQPEWKDPKRSGRAR